MTNMLQELTYPISLNYGKKDWGIIEGLRELLANMLDTKETYRIEKTPTGFAIEDDGDGLPLHAFIFGESTRDDSQVGGFGEGMKMSFIAFLREQRQIIVRTKGFDVQVTTEDALGIGKDIMKLYFYENTRTSGTRFEVECTKEEMEAAQHLFLALSPHMTPVAEGVYQPAGGLYVLGLRTSLLSPLLFSYNFSDKRMVNRDRNILDTATLHENMATLLSETTSSAVIEAYLTGFEKESFYEYQLAIKPLHIKVWKQTLRRVFSKVCIGTAAEYDVKAFVMKYRVLTHLPHQLRRVLEGLGVKGSDAIAASYEGEALFTNDQWIYPITAEYASHWSISDGVREFIANALDASIEKPTLSWDNGIAQIEDSGKGLKRTHFLFGESEKEEGSIGRFGEGLKMGAFVFARTGRMWVVETVGRTYRASMKEQAGFPKPLFTIESEPNQRTSGTRIQLECSAEEWAEATTCFLVYRPPTLDVLEHETVSVYPNFAGEIFVQGVKIQNENALFGYDLHQTHAVESRDRNRVDADQLKAAVREIFEKVATVELWKLWLADVMNQSHLLEYQLEFVFEKGSPSMRQLRRAIKETWEKVLMESKDAYENFVCHQEGHVVLSGLSAQAERILRQAGVKGCAETAGKYKERTFVTGDRLVYAYRPTQHNVRYLILAASQLHSVAAVLSQSGVQLTDKQDALQIAYKGEPFQVEHFMFDSEEDTDVSNPGEMLRARLKQALVCLIQGGASIRIESHTEDFYITGEHQEGLCVMSIYRKAREVTHKHVIITIERTDIRKRDMKSLMLNMDAYVCQEGPILFLKTPTPMLDIFIEGIKVYSVSRRQLVRFHYSFTKEEALVQLNGNEIRIDATLLREAWDAVTHEGMIRYAVQMLEDSHSSVWPCVLGVNGWDTGVKQQFFEPVLTHEELWRKAVHSVHHSKIAFATGQDEDGVARDRGFRVIVRPSSQFEELLQKIGVVSSAEAIKHSDASDNVIKEHYEESKLRGFHKQRWQEAKTILQRLYGDDLVGRLNLVKAFRENVNGQTQGLYCQATERIFILHALLGNKSSLEQVLGVIIHEYIHHTTKASDRTRLFERGLTDELGRLAAILGSRNQE